MSDYRVVRNQRTGEVVLPRARWCSSFTCRLRGLMFTASLPGGEGLLFVSDGEDRFNSAIHMLFMGYSIGVVWLNSGGEVVDAQLAKPWRPAYAPARAAKYYIEANPDVLTRVQVGDVLVFDEKTT